MAYEEIGYWKEENWNRFFSKVWEISSEANPGVKIRKKLEKKWDQKSIPDIFEKYKRFFLPEVVRTEEREITVKPWFLRFFDVSFTDIDYEGFRYRIEHGKDFEDLKISTGYGDGEGLSLTYFNNVASGAKDVVDKAEEKGFEIDKRDLSEIELEDPEDIRKELIETFDKAVNLSLPYEPLMFFVWSLSHGVMEDYAKRVYEHFDESLIFERLGFEPERNYDLIVKGDLRTLSYQIYQLNDYIRICSDSSSVIELLGIENKPKIMDLYYDRAFESLSTTHHK